MRGILGAGVSPNALFRAGGRLRHHTVVPYMVSGGICDRFAGSSRHPATGRVIFDFPAGLQRANIRLDLCTGYPASVRVVAVIADACALSGITVANAALHLQLRSAGNGDVISVTLRTAADACAAEAAGGLDLAAGDGDVAACATIPAADSCAACAAGDGDVAAGAIPAAADARAVGAALCGQLAVFVLVLNGQAAAVVLFKAGMLFTALELAFAVQLDADISRAGRGNGGLTRTAHVDVHAGEGDACGLILLRVDGEGVIRGASHNDGGAALHSGSASLRDRLPAAPGVYGDVALADVPLRRQRRHG